MLRTAKYLSNVIVFSGISLFGYVSNANLGYLRYTLDCCGTMADGRFLRSHGLNLYHLQYDCLELLSIWELPLYTVVYRSCEMCVMPKLGYLLDPLDHRDNIADGRFLKGHGLNLYHLQYECLGLLSIWVSQCKIGYIAVCIREQCQVGVSLRPFRLLRHDGWWSFSERPWPQLISPAIWMLRAAYYLTNIIV